MGVYTNLIPALPSNPLTTLLNSHGILPTMIFQRWKEKIKNYAQDVFTEKTTPHSIALGFAIGTLISILPTPGFNLLLALLVSIISKKVNRVSLFIGILFWNPLTSPVVYYLSYTLGDLIFGATPIIMYDISFM